MLACLVVVVFFGIDWGFTRKDRCATNLVKECILMKTLAHFHKTQVCTV